MAISDEITAEDLVMTTERLQDKVILIVGGTSGLGLSAASACIAEGARVVVTGRDSEKCDRARNELTENGRADRVLAIPSDAMDAASSNDVVKRAVEKFGRLDGLYHVAGGSGRRAGDGPLHEISNDGWRFTLDLNLSSLFYSNRAAVRQFIEQGTGGSILNMTSVLADSPSPKYFATHTYAATKAGAIGLTKACAAYYADQSIRFNAIAPSLFETPLAQRAVNDDQIMKYVRSKQPLDGGRAGQPSDTDDAVVFFLSDAAKFVTGQVLGIDGGWSVTEGQV
jgi:NAD(P)-dependent dehydrogenase (short-subunit alcohol dehydrogenase family)